MAPGVKRFGQRSHIRSYCPCPHSRSLRAQSGTPAATRWPTRGTTTRAIQGWLGHRSITSTAVYAALAPNRFKDRAGLGCRDFLDGVSDGAEAQSARMTLATGSLPQAKLRHPRLADLVSVMRLERTPRFIQDCPQKLDRLWIVGAVPLHEGALQTPRPVSDHPSRTTCPSVV
jgi:hypothetical protein